MGMDQSRVHSVRLPSPEQVYEGPSWLDISLRSPLTVWERLAVEAAQGCGLTVVGDLHLVWRPAEAVDGDFKRVLDLLDSELVARAARIEEQATTAHKTFSARMVVLASNFGFDVEGATT